VERLGLHPVEGAERSELARRAEFVVVPTHERFRDQQALGVDPTRVVARGKPVSGLPPCLAKNRHELPAEEDVLELGALSGPEQVDVVGFTHHFLKNLHRARSPRCNDCVHVAECSGVHVNQGRHWGLGRLTPIRAPETATNE
jgi:hypothetical protein